MRTHCIYKKCRFNCKNARDHKVVYAKMKTHFNTKHIIKSKNPSSKVNWEKYNQMFS